MSKYQTLRYAVVALLLCPGTALASPTSDMSLAAIVNGATPTVKAVIILLLLVSVASWTVLVRKVAELRKVFRSANHAIDRLKLARSLQSVQEIDDLTILHLVDIARREVDQSDDILRAGKGEGVSERVALLLSRTEDAAARKIGSGVGLFATAASIAPFVGLFGTVWGIMHSFIGIAQSNSTSLAVVAPGIAEALLATAIGLGVAIPATVMYNTIGKAIGEYRARLMDCSARILCLVSRDVERLQLPTGNMPLRAIGDT